MSLSGDLRGLRAAPQVPDPKRWQGDPGELFIFASTVSAADALSGASVRAAIEAHLSRDPQASVSIWTPQDPEMCRLWDNLLGPLPKRCNRPVDVASTERDPRVLLPAERVKSADDAKLRTWALPQIAGAVRLRQPVAHVLAQGLLALAENGLAYADDSPCGVISACAIDVADEYAQIAVVDLGSSLSGARNPRAELRSAIQGSFGELGGLSNALRLADQVNLTAELVIAAGTARAKLTAGGWRTTEAAFAPGFTAGLQVGAEIPGLMRTQ